MVGAGLEVDPLSLYARVRPRNARRRPTRRPHVPCPLPWPSKLHPLYTSYPSTLIIRPGNAHHINNVTRVLTHDERHLVDAINFTIGNKPDLKAASQGDKGDAHVWEKGMETLLAALDVLRNECGLQGSPLLCVVSTTGISDKRDISLVFYPLYYFMLAVPYKNKRGMEESILQSQQMFVLVRPSLLWDGGEDGKVVRVGISDVKTGGMERKQIGYTISRKEVGHWMFENLVQTASEGIVFEGKAISLTFW